MPYRTPPWLLALALLGVQSVDFAAQASGLTATVSEPSVERDESSRDTSLGVAQWPARVGLQEAIAVFRKRGLDLLLADVAVVSAEADVATAAAVANPTAQLVLGHTLNYTTHPFDEHEECAGCSPINIVWDLSDEGAVFDVLLGKRGLRSELARVAFASAKLARRDAERTMISVLKQQYITVVAAQANLEFAKRLRASFAKTVALSRRRFPGTIDEGALARVELRQLEIDQSVSVARSEREQALIGLAYLFGARGPIHDVEVDASAFAFRVPPALEGATERSLTLRALSRRPDAHAARNERKRADAGLRLAKRTMLPEIELGLEYNAIGYGQNAASPAFLAAGVSSDIPVFYQRQGEIRTAQADLKRQAVSHAKVQAQIVSDVAAAWSAFVTARELVGRLESELVARAERMRDVVEIQYNAGASSLTNFLDAERVYIETEREHLRCLYGYWTAIFQLEQAVGVEFAS